MTKSETSEKAAAAVLAEIEKMIAEEVTDEELADRQGRNPQLRGVQLRHQARDPRPHGHVRALRLRADFLQKYQEEVKAMTKADVLAATQAVWKPDQMTILAVGNYAGMGRRLHRPSVR